MLNFFFPALVFFTIFILNFSLKKKKSMSKFVINCYFIIIICSFVLLLIESKYSNIQEDFLLGSVFFSFLVFIHLLPFVFVRDDKIEVIKILDYKLMRIISIFTIFFSFISIAYFFSIVIRVFTSPNLEMFRHTLITEGHPYITPGLINTISGVIALLYCVPMLLGFLNMANNGSRRMTQLLFLSSLSYPIFVFSYFGRDGVVFWLMSIFSNYIFFKPFLDKKRQKKVISFINFFLTLGLFVFLLITFTRFGEFKSSLLSILSYSGQQFLNFCTYFDLEITNTGGARTFTIFHDLVNDVEYTETLKNLRWELAFQGHEYMSWEWGTMFKDLYTDFGSLGVSLLVIIYAIYQFIVFKKMSTRPDLIMCLFFIIMCQLSWQGIFYFKNYSFGGNSYIILTFMLPLLSFIFKSKFNVTLEKK